MTVEASANATDNGAAITKVKGVYTGVQNVSLKVDTKGVGDLNESVFAVADNDGYIIAAVVPGTEGSASNTYAYAVKGAQNEYVARRRRRAIIIGTSRPSMRASTRP